MKQNLQLQYIATDSRVSASELPRRARRIRVTKGRHVTYRSTAVYWQGPKKGERVVCVSAREGKAGNLLRVCEHMANPVSLSGILTDINFRAILFATALGITLCNW